MRGVHSPPNSMCKTSVGSSPHARGPRHGFRRRDQGQGIIPACAGSTQRAFPIAIGYEDHPRMRGVHAGHHLEPGGCGGSSPHARGPPAGVNDTCIKMRIIPACAGSTLLLGTVPTIFKDHPRMRGVHNLTIVIRTTPPGIIPACAGSTH